MELIYFIRIPFIIETPSNRYPTYYYVYAHLYIISSSNSLWFNLLFDYGGVGSEGGHMATIPSQ